MIKPIMVIGTAIAQMRANRRTSISVFFAGRVNSKGPQCQSLNMLTNASILSKMSSPLHAYYIHNLHQIVVDGEVFDAAVKALQCNVTHPRIHSHASQSPSFVNSVPRPVPICTLAEMVSAR